MNSWRKIEVTKQFFRELRTEIAVWIDSNLMSYNANTKPTIQVD